MVTVRSGSGGGGLLLAPGAILKGTLLSLAVALLASLFLSIVIIAAGWHEIPPGLVAFHYVSIGLGGVLAARRARRLGWIHGGIVGLVYTALLSALFADELTLGMFLTTAWLKEAAWGFVAGVVGGILGVNA